jgi:hypothetical protein
MAAEFVTASTACIVANMITHPLETIKTFQQLPGQGSISTLSAASKIVGEGGYSSLYKGLNASLVRAVISGGGRLSLFGLFKDVAFDHGKLARNSKGSPIASELPLRGMLASLAGMIAALAGSPADLIRTRQAAFKGTYSQTPSIAGVVKEIFSANGLSGLFAGSTSLLARAFSFNLAQLTTYDYCKKSAMEMLHLEADHVITHVAAAMGAGFAATTVSAPFENIKTMTQMSVSQSITSAATSMYQEGGVYIFFRGWTPLYIKVAPHTLVVFVVAERLRALFSLRPME